MEVGKWACRICLDISSARVRKDRHCKVCGCLIEKRRSLCPKHIRNVQHWKEMKKIRSDNRIKAGLCIACGKSPPVPNGLKCDICLGTSRTLARDTYRKIRLEVIALYGGKCVCCGETEPDFLTLDHINNDGFLQRKRYPSGSASYKIVMKERPTDIQILCYNCNCAKGHYGICPHEIARGQKRPYNCVVRRRRIYDGNAASQIQ